MPLGITTSPPSKQLNLDFLKFWAGQTISNLGNSVTLFALPLLMYKLTGSAFNLGLMSAAQFVPYLLFGLVLGAWVDRVDRRRLMILTDIGRAALIATIPILAEAGKLHTWWIYVVGFLSSTLTICFDASQFAAIPSLVETDDLVTANGRIQASFSAASIVGPIIGGALISVIPIESVLYIDATSFLISSLSISLIQRSFNATREDGETRASLREDVVEGLRYVLSHPVLRNISIMMALINFVGASIYAQLVLFASDRLDATDAQIGWLYAADAIGVVCFSLAAGSFRKRWSFSRVALGALMIGGIATAIFSQLTNYWIALMMLAISSGVGIMFNINTGSLRQAIVPNHLLGRVISIASVLAWSAIPLGSLLGGIAIEKTDNVALVYFAIGALQFLIALAFSRTALGHAEDFLPAEAVAASNDVELTGIDQSRASQTSRSQVTP
jgi:MFS family permease